LYFAEKEPTEVCKKCNGGLLLNAQMTECQEAFQMFEDPEWLAALTQFSYDPSLMLDDYVNYPNLVPFSDVFEDFRDQLESENENVEEE